MASSTTPTPVQQGGKDAPTSQQQGQNSAPAPQPGQPQQGQKPIFRDWASI